MNERIHHLCDFLNESRSLYHVVAAIRRWLLDDGFVRLDETKPWELIPGGKYFIDRNGSSILAFRIPQDTPVGYLMSTSHSDRPAFKVKEDGELVGEYTRLATERYGGMLIYPWLDRPCPSPDGLWWKPPTVSTPG